MIVTRRRWIIIAAFLLALGGSFIGGYLFRTVGFSETSTVEKKSNPSKSAPSTYPQQGRWGKAKGTLDFQALTEDQRELVSKLQAIGYLSGYEKAPELKGVTIYIPEAAYNGLNLLTSGHSQEAVLMDMQGTILHAWSYAFHDAFSNSPAPLKRYSTFWRRVHLYENGDLLAIYEGIGLIKLDIDSNLLWAIPCGAHHDLFVDPSGLIYVLTREIKFLPRIHEDKPVLEDFITVINPDGKIVRQVSLLEAFERSTYASFLDKMPESGDLFHTNTIEIIMDESFGDHSSIFAQGNVLLSLLTTNVIAILDMDKEMITWALSGQWKRQHQPTLLANGNILLLDNCGGHLGMSKVIEINPFTQEIVWSYEGAPENGFFTNSCGSNQRLLNGNTLITESDSGRAFEVTPENRIVWEFYNPARAGENEELIATLFEVVRLDSDFSTNWL